MSLVHIEEPLRCEYRLYRSDIECYCVIAKVGKEYLITYPSSLVVHVPLLNFLLLFHTSTFEALSCICCILQFVLVSLGLIFEAPDYFDDAILVIFYIQGSFLSEFSGSDSEVTKFF